MEWYWTWGGKSFGYRVDDNLFTSHGKNVGYFVDQDVYSCKTGRYLGEIMSENRLITNKSKSSYVSGVRGQVTGANYANYANYAGYAMYAGFEDFPAQETF